MKTIISLIIAWLFAGNIATAQITKAELQVAGLTCSMCSRSVDKSLRTLDFIDSVGIDLSKASFVLFFKKDKTVDLGQIKKKVEDAGFFVASLKIEYKFADFKLENNSSLTYQKITFYFLNVTPKTLNGAVTFKIMDKGFVSDKVYKKYASSLNGTTSSGTIYHVML
ncbi:MAG TPA: heavy metal-associated domain-containing protein [Bacteroidia bacterium]|nr:heavy metal-associated domain-containing protein [Bacteroidia bacterium]